MDIPHLFTYSTVDEHLGCFHFLVIKYSATMNVFPTCLLISICAHIYLGVEVLVHTVYVHSDIVDFAKDI